MSYLPDLKETATSRMMTETFYGFDRNMKSPDGTWCEEIGLSTRSFPLFGVRAPRGYMSVPHEEKITGIACRDRLVHIEQDGTLWYDSIKVDVRLDPDTEKQIVSMGAYLCVFPDGVYFNTHDLKDCGTMGNKVEINGEVRLAVCTADGDEYALDGVPVSRSEPADPKNGDYWIDSSERVHVLKKYSESQAMWVTFTTCYVRIAADGIGKGFREQDAVRIHGMHFWNATQDVYRQIETLNNDVILQKVEDNAIIVAGILDKAVTLIANGMTVERRVPHLDYVCELDNRLWGCRYGVEEGENVNTIYASAQGDCRNWYRYAGISTDSYAVNVGSDGVFTGMAAYGGNVLAFKENCVHKVYGTLPSNFTVSTTQCRGVAPGSGRSLAVVNERLYYLSRNGVCVYDGSLPASVSDVFCGEKFYDGCACAADGVYYICMRNERGDPSVWTFDSSKGVWHHPFDEDVVMFAVVEGEPVYLDSDGNVVSVNGAFGEKEKDVPFDAISSIIGFTYSGGEGSASLPEHKYISRFVLRVKMHRGDLLEVLTKYDSEGEWISQGEISMEVTNSFTLPVIPRRCDHMQIRLRGHGDVRVFSIAKVLEVGSDA